MYLSLAELEAFLSSDLAPTAIQALVPHAVPSVFLLSAATGPSQLGGRPLMHPEQAWPIRQPPADLAERLALWDSVEEVQNQLPHPHAMSFAAQLDLAEVTALGGPAADLPTTGRLLFFLDMEVSYWEGGPQACAVIWDKTPEAEAQRAAPPTELVARDAETLAQYAANTEAAQNPAAIDELIAELAEISAELAPDEPFDAEGMRQRLLEDARNPRPFKSYILPPEQPVSPRIGYMLPGYQNVEYDAMIAALSGRAWRSLSVEAKEDLLSSLEEMGHDWPDGLLAHGMGLPIPEQDDPRADALPGVGDYDPKAAKWRLLLQLSVSDLLQDDMAEGQFYFLIHKDALARHDFSQVYLTYQQT